MVRLQAAPKKGTGPLKSQGPSPFSGRGRYQHERESGRKSTRECQEFFCPIPDADPVPQI